MADKVVESELSTYSSQIADSVETAAGRLVAAGCTRIEALTQIKDVLTMTLGLLGGIGLGDVARLRRQMQVAAVKLGLETHGPRSEEGSADAR